MSYKKYFFMLSIFLVFFCGCLIGTNCYADIHGYYRALKGTKDSGMPDDDYNRLIKAKYVQREKDKYNAVILGGSKAGGMQTEVLNEATGLSFYNSYFTVGNFRDYKAYAEYYIQVLELKALVLHISSVEALYYAPPTNDKIYKLPSVVTGALPLTEMLSFTTENELDVARKVLKNFGGNSNNYEDKITGEHNLQKYYDVEADTLVKESVLLDYEELLDVLCNTKTRNLPACEQNIETLKEIKDMCDENNVKFIVIIGAVFLTEHAEFEGEEFYDYLKDMVKIINVYDFSDFNDINMNPYNFFNSGHYFYEVGDKMIRNVFGMERDLDFGTYITSDNIEDYIEKRRRQYKSIINEYEQTGTVCLGQEDSPSNICR